MGRSWGKRLAQSKLSICLLKMDKQRIFNMRCTHMPWLISARRQPAVHELLLASTDSAVSLFWVYVLTWKEKRYTCSHSLSSHIVHVSYQWLGGGGCWYRQEGLVCTVGPEAKNDCACEDQQLFIGQPDTTRTNCMCGTLGASDEWVCIWKEGAT